MACLAQASGSNYDDPAELIRMKTVILLQLRWREIIETPIVNEASVFIM